jgi:transposase
MNRLPLEEEAPQEKKKFKDYSVGYRPLSFKTSTVSRLIYLPPYSPEYNPIEHYWALLKKTLKKVRKKVTDIWDSLTMAMHFTQNFRLL